MIYFATGNPGPDFNGAVRPGDNLFTVSFVAIEARTGEYRWHYQAVHHDSWDYDLPTPVVLFDIEIDGRARKGLAGTGKTGWVYLLDRETGEAAELFDNGLVLVGSVDTVCRQMEQLLERLPARWLFAWTYNGLIPHAKLMKSIEMFSTQVRPRFA